jgi:hypothetical protein
MELTMTNAINATATSERELTIDELDTVSGGEFAVEKLFDKVSPLSGGGGGGGAGPAIDAWNKLLGNYGF